MLFVFAEDPVSIFGSEEMVALGAGGGLVGRSDIAFAIGRERNIFPLAGTIGAVGFAETFFFAHDVNLLECV